MKVDEIESKAELEKNGQRPGKRADMQQVQQQQQVVVVVAVEAMPL